MMLWWMMMKKSEDNVIIDVDPASEYEDNAAGDKDG